LRLQAKIKAFIVAGVVWLFAAGALGAATPARATVLQKLAARAQDRRAWPELRRFAEAASDPEQRGEAYLALGYQEYQAKEFALAADSLGHAVETDFCLADFALYYQASALRQGGEPAEAAEMLDGFSARYPQSPLRFDALALAAQSLLDSSQPERAVQALIAEPLVRRRPALAILLAQAYRDTKRPAEAARIFQEVYYAFPTAPESATAQEALASLQTELGKAFPEVSEEIQTGRADILVNRSRLQDAIVEYEALLAKHPQSALAPCWAVGRAGCLLRLREASKVIDSLAESFSASPQYDAQRMAALTQAYLQNSDAESALVLLDQLRTVYPTSPAYARALSSFGNFYARQGDWDEAGKYYQPLAQSFPQTNRGREADWYLAWSYYLARDLSRAKAALISHLTRYPDSDHVPAALYWLGRIAEQEGAIEEACGYYGALRQRFVQSYYAWQATNRLKRLPAQKASASPGEVPATTAALIKGIPRRDPPPLAACGQSAPSELLRSFIVLKDLSLDDLAEDYLRGTIADHPNSPDLQLALSRLYSEDDRPASALFAAKRVVEDLYAFNFAELPEEVWRLLYPRAYWSLVRRQARATGLNPYLVMALIRQESAFNPRALSVADARGLMQILPQTVSRSRRGRVRAARNLFSPTYNVRFGTRHLRGLLRKLDGDPAQAVAAYHAGISRVTDWTSRINFQDSAEFVESIPIPTTRGYVEWVMRDTAIYDELMTGKAKFAACRPSARPAAKTRGSR
jgi:soluble lytic murein transglycosylase